jgi:hypothetical protein
LAPPGFLAEHFGQVTPPAVRFRNPLNTLAMMESRKNRPTASRMNLSITKLTLSETTIDVNRILPFVRVATGFPAHGPARLPATHGRSKAAMLVFRLRPV